MFRFSIRDLLLITSLVATLSGWWCEHRARASDLYRLKQLHIEYDQLSASKSIIERAIDRAGYAVVCGFDRSYLVRKDAKDENSPSN